MKGAGFLRGRRMIACLAGLFLLAACGLSIDADQARVCRSTLPALNPGASIVIHRIQEGPAARSLKVLYTAQHPDRPLLDRFAICTFAAEGLSLNKAELTGLATE